MESEEKQHQRVYRLWTLAPNPFPGRLQAGLQDTDQAGGLGGLAGRPGHQREGFRVNTLIPSQKDTGHFSTYPEIGGSLQKSDGPGL